MIASTAGIPIQKISRNRVRSLLSFSTLLDMGYCMRITPE